MVVDVIAYAFLAYGGFLLLAVVVVAGVVVERGRLRSPERRPSVCAHEDDVWSCVREIPRGGRYRVELSGCDARVTCRDCGQFWTAVPLFGERRST